MFGTQEHIHTQTHTHTTYTNTDKHIHKNTKTHECMHTHNFNIAMPLNSLNTEVI